MLVVTLITAIVFIFFYTKEKKISSTLNLTKYQLDSAYALLGYEAYFYRDNTIVFYELNMQGDTIAVDVPDIEKITRLFENAKNYREIYDDLFELTSNNSRYELALEYYLDPLMHQEYLDRNGIDFKSKYTHSQRIEIVKKITNKSVTFNRLYCYGFAFDWYREIDPTAIREIEMFLFFTE